MRPITTLALLALAMTSHGADAADEVVRIGSAEPVSGPSAHLGKDTENGARMAIDELNARHFTVGGKPVRLQLQAEDDAGDPRQGTAVAQKLVDARVVGVVGHLNSGTSVPASKIYAAAGIPQITPSATTPLYTHQGFKSAFRLVANDSMVGAALGRYAVQHLKTLRVAVIDDRSAFGQGLADEFVKGLKGASHNVEIVGRQYTNDRATDFSAQLTQLKSKHPDLIFFGGMDAVAGPMLKQMKALGLDARFLGGDGICSESLPRLAGDGLGEDKVFCAVAGGVTGAQEQAYAAFVERYRKTFKIELQTYAPYAYDAVMLMAAAMQQARSTDPAQFLPALSAIRYQGVTGTIAFDANGDLRDAALTLYTYRHGKQTKLEVIR